MLPAMRISRRLIAPAVLLALIAAVWALGLSGRLSWASLAQYQSALKTQVTEHPILAPCLFEVAYIASVTLSLPQAGLLTLIGGLLFGALAGGALASTGATIGAILLFVIARSAFAEVMARRSGAAGGAPLAKLRDELGRNGFSYLLAIRLIPVVPFWLVNLAAAFGGMPLRHFAIATMIGILPATFITAWIGAGIGDVLARGEKPDVSFLFSWPILTPLLALACLSIAPVIWRKLRPRDA
jgi:uncharacterized membrane protein YdjX (TVP38/TMEM64 family)